MQGRAKLCNYLDSLKMHTTVAPIFTFYNLLPTIVFHFITALYCLDFLKEELYLCATEMKKKCKRP